VRDDGQELCRFAVFVRRTLVGWLGKWVPGRGEGREGGVGDDRATDVFVQTVTELHGRTATVAIADECDTKTMSAKQTKQTKVDHEERKNKRRFDEGAKFTQGK
jgi:hypothetical protein